MIRRYRCGRLEPTARGRWGHLTEKIQTFDEISRPRPVAKLKNDGLWPNVKFAEMIMTRVSALKRMAGSTYSTVLNVRFKHWLLSVHTATAESSAMGWKAMAGPIVAPIVRARQVLLRWLTGRRRFAVSIPSQERSLELRSPENQWRKGV